MVRIAKTTESMVHSETLSTQYLETVKSTKTIEGVKYDNSKNKHRNRYYKKECYKCGKEGHFTSLCHSRPKSTSRSSSSMQQGNGRSKPQQEHQSQCSAHEVDDHLDFQFACDC